MLTDLLSRLGWGDMLVIWKLDRLGCNLQHLVTFTNDLMARQIGLISLNDPIDTTTPQGRLVFNIFFGALAKFERDLIRERTQAGFQAARAHGGKGGRPAGLSKQAQATAMAAETLYREGKLSVRTICDQLDITKPTLYAYLKQRRMKIGTQRTPRRRINPDIA